MCALVTGVQTCALPIFSSADLTATLALLPVFGGIAINSNAYGIQALRGVPHGLSRVILSLLFTAATLLFVAFYMKASMPLSRAIFGMGVVLSIGALTADRKRTRLNSSH